MFIFSTMHVATNNHKNHLKMTFPKFQSWIRAYIKYPQFMGVLHTYMRICRASISRANFVANLFMATQRHRANICGLSVHRFLSSSPHWRQGLSINYVMHLGEGGQMKSHPSHEWGEGYRKNVMSFYSKINEWKIMRNSVKLNRTCFSTKI